MITDRETNMLFLADTLSLYQPVFYGRFKKMLDNLDIQYRTLPGTMDIWAVDYMPVQISLDKFVQFIYDPDYLQEEELKKTISDTDSISNAVNIKTIKSNLVVDGGNVSRAKDKVIMCDKVFRENPLVPPKKLIEQLKGLFEVDKLFFVPWDEGDFTGHVDGMLRFLDSDTVLINNYSHESKEFRRKFRKSLKEAGVESIEIPYQPTEDQTSISAEGIYINFLQMEKVVIIPAFNSRYDDEVVRLFEKIFYGQKVIPILANEIAKEGGILNCISWNIAT